MSINSITVKQQSVLFAQISKFAYLQPHDAIPKFADMGYEAEYLDSDGSQAFVLSSLTDLVIVCRGTQPTEWEDIRNDFDIDLIDFPAGGQVHQGFVDALDEIWPSVVTTVARAGTRNVWFTGHSLGAAMSMIAAMRCVTTKLKVADVNVFAYGAPKIGDWDLVQVYDSLGIRTTRFVNDNDVVARLPPYPYRTIQSGDLVYMNHWGNVRDLTPYQRAKDRVRGFFAGLMKVQVDPVIDHRMKTYLANLQRWADGTEVPQKGL